MGTINIVLGEDTQLNLILGQQLENAVTAVVFDFSSWQTTYGTGTLALSVQRPGDEMPYAVTLATSGTNATWSVTNLDTAYKGVGHIQLTYTVGSAIKKSVVYKFTVYESLGATGEYPSPGQTWQEEMEEEIADVKQDLNYMGKPLLTSVNRLYLEFVNNKYIKTNGTEGSYSGDCYTIVQVSKGDVLECDVNPDGNVCLLGFSTSIPLSFPIEVVQNVNVSTLQHYTFEFDRDGYAVITGKTGTISICKVVSTLWDEVYNTFETTQNVEYLTTRSANLIDIFNTKIYKWFPNSSTQKISENDNVRSIIIPVDSDNGSTLALIKGINSCFRVATFTTDTPSVGTSYSALTNFGDTTTSGTITIDSTIKSIMVWYWYNDDADSFDVLSSLCVLYGNKPVFYRSREIYNDGYVPKMIFNESLDLNDDANLETGTIYFSSTALVNAPLGIANGAIVLTNLSFYQGGNRRVLQMVYFQTPTHLRGSIWYRMFDPVNKTAYVDWTCPTKSYFLPNVTIFGDSITAGYPQASNDSYHWWAYLQKYFSFSNFAQTGSGIIYVNNNKSGTIFADQFSDSDCNYLCIFMGTNDYGNDMPLGTTSDNAGTNTVCAGLKYIIETVMTTVPTLSIIGILPLNRSDYGTASTNWAYGTTNTAGYTLGELCDSLKTIYESYGIPVIDNRLSLFQKLNLGNLLGDGLHPNITGYRKLAQHLGGEIKKIITPI